MKEYILKNEEGELLMSGVFDTEQKAWNIMCIKTAHRFKKGEWGFLYDKDGKLQHANFLHKLYNKDLIAYELVISPDIYKLTKVFDKDIPAEQVWESMRLTALLANNNANYHAKLCREDKILYQYFLNKTLIEELPQQQEEQEDLLTSISKIKI